MSDTLKTDITDPFYDRLTTFLDVSNSESDRGRVLVATSLVEEMLAEIIRAKLLVGPETESLFNGGNAAIGTLSARTYLSRSLCLISAEECRDINTIRKIRNKFAHNVLCSFDDRQIIDLTNNLKVGMAAIDNASDEKARVTDAKKRFSMVATALVSILYNRAHYVQQTKVTETHWPG